MADDVSQMPSSGGPEEQSSGPPPDSSTPQMGGGSAPPIAGGMGTPVMALGRQAEIRNKLRAFVMFLQKEATGAFEFNSDEGKAVFTALKALGSKFGGGREEDRNPAQVALMQRAMQQKGMGQGPGQMSQGAMAGAGMPKPNTGPIPAAVGGAM